MTCEVEGCERGPQTDGSTLFRVSPKGKGQKFVGRCREHLETPPDPELDQVVSVFEGR